MAALTLTRLRAIWRAEFPRLVRFGVVGVSLLLATIGLYALLSRVLWPTGSRTIEYAFVAIFMSWLNYEVNGRFTFRFRARSVSSAARFVSVIVVATGLNSFLFWFLHEVLHLWDFWVILINTAIVAMFTFTAHRLFTFHERPWRFFQTRRGG